MLLASECARTSCRTFFNKPTRGLYDSREAHIKRVGEDRLPRYPGTSEDQPR